MADSNFEALFQILTDAKKEKDRVWREFFSNPRTEKEPDDAITIYARYLADHGVTVHGRR